MPVRCHATNAVSALPATTINPIANQNDKKMRRKSEFIRTPKYSIRQRKDSWTDKQYVPLKISPTVVVEAVLAVYCLFGVVSSVYLLELAAVPFQLLFFLGFGMVAVMSIKHARLARALKMNKQTTVA